MPLIHQESLRQLRRSPPVAAHCCAIPGATQECSWSVDKATLYTDVLVPGNDACHRGRLTLGSQDTTMDP